MVYLNCAATSYPKPECVVNAFNESINALPSGQFRSAGIFDNGEIFDKCRQNLGKILGVADYNQIFFSSGATESLNQILYGLGIPSSRILTTQTEHNSVLRPLFNLESIKGTPVIADCDENGTVSPAEIDRLLTASEKNNTDKIKAVVISHSSNVTGAVQDMEEIGRIAKAHDCILVADCAQSAGCIPVCGDSWGADAIAFTGHKGLLGMQGTGGYYIRRGISFKPFKYGGTGKDSRVISYEDSEYELEPGTQNSPGIATLYAATKRLLDRGIENIHNEELQKSEYLIKGLSQIDGVKIYGEKLSERGPVVSINIRGIAPSDAAYILQNSYDIITRAGLQCAPLIHEALGCADTGTLRISFSSETTSGELDLLTEAVKDIAEAAFTA